MRLVRSIPALVATAALLAGCGSQLEGTEGAASRGDEPPPPTGVVATTADGTSVEFTDFAVACRPSEDGQPTAQVVYALAGFGDDATKPRQPRGPAMMIEAADSARGRTVELPHSETYGQEETFISLFITEAGKEQELSSSTELSTGEVEVVSASCEPAPRLEVRIDGALESELSDGVVEVVGHVTAG